MPKQRIHRKNQKSPAERAREKVDRDRLQREKPSLTQLVASGEYSEPVSLGAYLDAKVVANYLKLARAQSGMSLSEVSKSTGIDPSQISRLESGSFTNVTITTLNRLADAYGGRFRLFYEAPMAAAGAK